MTDSLLASTTNPMESWENVAKQVKARINNAIPASYRIDPALIPSDLSESVLHLPEISGVLTPRELEITDSYAYELLPKLANRTYTAFEVTEAFCKRATIAHQAANCLAHVMFQSALKRATELDEHLSRTGTTIGPLHGLPISVKDCVHLTGTPSTVGYTAWADKLEDDAFLCKIFRDAGAIFHVKTTNPQALMAIETTSNIYGVTTNPHNRTLSPGGSTGGEGALIAMRGSVLGIGTDMGGSLRIPAASCGIYSLKPSAYRNPQSGISGNYKGRSNLVAVFGPMATCVQDLQLFQKVALSSHPWKTDPSILPLPWNTSLQEQLPEKLKFGIVWDDGVVQPHPPITRALKKAVDALTAAGHEVVDWDTSAHAEIQGTFWKMMLPDGGLELRDTMALGNEPAIPQVASALSAAHTTSTLPVTYALNNAHTSQQLAYSRQWTEKSVDYLLAPTNPSAASAHGEGAWAGYTGVFSALDFAVGVIPVSVVGEERDEKRGVKAWEGKKEFGGLDGFYKRCWEEGDKYKGAPAGLQVVGRRFGEEGVLGVMGMLNSLVGRF